MNNYHALPSLEELKLGIRDSQTLDKVYALEAIETDAEPFLLLDYLKNEYAQKEVLFQLDSYIDKSIAFETADEVVRSLQDITLDLETKVEITPEEESMQKIALFESDEQIAARIKLGLNEVFDEKHSFLSSDYILMGGRRGAGKSLTCSNLARHSVDNGKMALYFSTEMEPRQVLQRDASIATQIPFSKIKNRNLDVQEWETLAKWWANRYDGGMEHFGHYLEHRDFELFHQVVSKLPLVPHHLDIIYDNTLTIGRIRTEVAKRVALGLPLGVIIVDYIQKVRKSVNSSGRFEWTEQIEISENLKQLASDTGVPVFSPYQTDATGEARFAKGILDAADAALVLDPHKHEDNIMSFIITKMRNADDDISFHSMMRWSTLTIGPENVDPPITEEEPKKSKTFGSKKTKVNPGVYDDAEDPPF
jgi:replicative DNA helicase